MNSYSSRDIIEMLEEEGWYYVNSAGDHWHFKHPKKSGKVTVTHPVKDIPGGTVQSILKQAGIKLK